jgi:hypothetical protein
MVYHITYREVTQTSRLLGARIMTSLRPSSLWHSFTLLSIFALLSLLKMRKYALCGRFWAEEGHYFYPHISSSPRIDGLFYIFNGHLELITNCVVWVAKQVDFFYAPLVTTYFSWLCQSIPIVIAIYYRATIGLSWLRIFIFIIAVCGLPQSPEVWANSINLHFHFALLTGLIAILPARTSREKWGFRLLLLMSGLSGIPANSLLPIFLIQASRSKSHEKWIQVALLSLTSLLQLSLLVFHGIDATRRNPTTDPLVFWLALVAQHWVSVLLPAEVGRATIERMNLLHYPDAVAWSIVVAATVSYLSVVATAILKSNRLSLTLLSSGFLLAAFCVLTSWGDRQALISAETGGRYFFAPNLLLTLALLLLIPKKLFAILLLTLWASAVLCRTPSYLPGPDWESAIRRAEQQRATTVAIWPYGWTTPYSPAKSE